MIFKQCNLLYTSKGKYEKILLVCAAGMSTSMLVKRMIDHANAISLEVNISALAIA
ncbi:PTS sugar transporter subunit IIB, partial [Escherichia coli]|nr:PTS sugar transporter subunit IIB [Escherichia coli]